MRINNFEEIAINSRRERILKMLPGIFEELNPENACRNAIRSYDSEIKAAYRVHVLGFGKAAFGMYAGIRDYAIDKVATASIIIPDDADVGREFPELKVFRGTHPITTKLSMNSSIDALEAFSDLSEDDILIVLISGGGSALFEIPEEGFSIDDVADISKCLMNSDADIYELNTVRSAISKVKGGKLARYLYPAKVIALVVSDVMGDDLNIIASGPLQKRKQDEGDLQNILKKYREKCPMLIDKVSLRGNVPSVPNDYFMNVHCKVILRNKDFVDKLYHELSSQGEDVVNLGSGIKGDVVEVSQLLRSFVKDVSLLKGTPFWFVAGGETTVNVTGSGTGGRNEELALRFMQKLGKDDFLFMSIGTDGIDGSSPAMGGIVDAESKKSIGIAELETCLQNNDSYNLLKEHNGAIITGRTGNNVSDIVIGYYRKSDLI